MCRVGWARRTPLAIVVALLAFTCALEAGAQGRGWDSTFIEQWVSALETHVPGTLDAPLAGTAAWDTDDLRKLWRDIHVLLTLVVAPRTTRFSVPPLLFETGPRSRDRVWFGLKKEEREVFEELATRVRRRGVTGVAHRAAILHTDILTRASSIAAPSDAAGPATRWFIGDGTGIGSTGQSLHWEIARRVLTAVEPDPRRDVFVRDWYRATVAMGQATEYFDAMQMKQALLLFPDDSELLLLAGAEREAFATPLFQAFAKSLDGSARLTGIESADAELNAASSFYRRAMAARPEFPEARVRLGRVLTMQAHYADAVGLLRQALSADLDASQKYLALLFLGDALEGAGDPAAALESLEQAAAIAPRSRAPYLGIARLSRERGDLKRTVSSLDRALAATAVEDVAEPMWVYRALPGLRRASLVDELRARVAADRP